MKTKKSKVFEYVKKEELITFLEDSKKWFLEKKEEGCIMFGLPIFMHSVYDGDVHVNDGGEKCLTCSKLFLVSGLREVDKNEFEPQVKIAFNVDDLQCDFDVDFISPFTSSEGDVYEIYNDLTNGLNELVLMDMILQAVELIGFGYIQKDLIHGYEINNGVISNKLSYIC